MFQSASVATFFDYVAALPRAGGLPRYDSFDLMAQYQSAPYIVVLDVLRNPDQFRVRFSGTKVVEMFDHETTGQVMDDVDTGAWKFKLIDVYHQATRDRLPQWTIADVVLDTPRTKRLFSYERLIIPLAEDDHQILHVAALIQRHEYGTAKGGFDHKSLSI